MDDANLLKRELSQYYGDETVYHHSLVRSFFYTPGVRYFLQNAGGGAYWMVDILATEPTIRKGVQEDGFCICLLKVVNGSGMLAVARDLSSEDGKEPSMEGVHFTRAIASTDCPDGIWKFYMEPTQVGKQVGIMLMLPNER